MRQCKGISRRHVGGDEHVAALGSGKAQRQAQDARDPAGIVSGKRCQHRVARHAQPERRDDLDRDLPREREQVGARRRDDRDGQEPVPDEVWQRGDVVCGRNEEGMGDIEPYPQDKTSGVVFNLVAPLPDQDKISGLPNDEELFRRNISGALD
ncbi:MAG TPA: hypothetical protein VGV17_04755 [Bosea sp. (in: a-proteobacteria)]|uniref:hypothetical protein n=1 Tax=Bosea sp. (in: a-proteobacteria) TaxID=1871050 RepID=UPI002DDCD31A|nr:hypothetical protein [Bosea sp. (in: a-proteobacteria)]HEV2553054.1 hypothetical protein [Bosea sp. (in: a-proteobacteria)]